MDAITWLIIILGVIALLMIALIIVITIFIRRQRTVFHVIMPDGSMINKGRMRLKVPNMTIAGRTYIYDDTCAVRRFLGKHVYYLWDSPSPIDFKMVKGKAEATLKPQDVEAILKSDLIQKLFAGDKIEKLILLLIVITLIVSIAGIIITLSSSGSTTCNLGGNITNSAFIRDACTQAIRGVANG